jgi:hypothetical protein
LLVPWEWLLTRCKKPSTLPKVSSPTSKSKRRGTYSHAASTMVVWVASCSRNIAVEVLGAAERV